MPIYEFYCNKCKSTIGEFMKIEDHDRPQKCGHCGKKMKRIFSVHNVHNFIAQDLNVTITDRKTGDEKILHAGSRQDLKDAINRYNDTPEAAKTGRVAVD